MTKVKIAIISTLFMAGIYAFAQQVIYTFYCVNCGKVSQSINPIAPRCCNQFMVKKINNRI